jgi:hypothetical protein
MVNVTLMIALFYQLLRFIRFGSEFSSLPKEINELLLV